MTEDAWWRSIINGLELKQDLVGDPEFVTEENKEEEQEDISQAQSAVMRFKLDLYLISPIGSNKAFLVTGNSQMEDAGIMKVAEALKLIERRKKRKS